MDNNVSPGPSKKQPTLAALDLQMKELLAAFQQHSTPDHKELSFYDDAVTIKRLKAKFHNEDGEWKLYLMMTNDYKGKDGVQRSFPPSIVVLPSSDLEELLDVLQGVALEVLTNGKSGDIPRIRNHPYGQETNSKKEEFWHKDMTISLGSGNLLVRPWRANTTHFIKMLSPRPPSADYDWLGVQLTLFIEEAVLLCSHLQEFLKELDLKGIRHLIKFIDH